MKKLITILGPTASGKTSLAVALAGDFIRKGQPAEILSADSRQVYRGMDIGTGKDLEEYNIPTTTLHSRLSTLDSPLSTLDSQQVRYHLIDICEPGTKYNLFQYQQDFLNAYEDIVGRGVQPILCGGTGLYIESVLKGYQLSPVPQNPELRRQLADKSLDELTVMLQDLKQQNGSVMHNKTDVDSCQRAIRAIEIEEYNLHTPTPARPFPEIPYIIIGVHIDREERREKITKRLKQRLEEGMVDEIRGLLDRGIPAEDLIYYGLEYKYVTEYVIGKLTYDDMFRQLEIAIHQFAKRQMTWFRGMERRGFTIHWIDALLPMEEKVEQIVRIVQNTPNTRNNQNTPNIRNTQK